ncbi:MAG: HisA/HisF-related TIM barrel protein, partial [Nitrospirota bacterium]
MLVIPAIDLKDGRCVRLRQGDMREETVYSEDPAAMALYWEGLGARLLHVVDLNGAIEGEPRNFSQIEAILKRAAVPVQI